MNYLFNGSADMEQFQVLHPSGADWALLMEFSFKGWRAIAVLHLAH